MRKILERKEKLKAGDVVGTAPRELMDEFRNLHARRAEAWRELSQIHEDSIKLWMQIESDLALSDEYSYSISPEQGDVRVLRKLTKSETYANRGRKEMLEGGSGVE